MSTQGGAERVAAILANELATIFDVTLISLVSDKGKSFYPLNSDVKFVTLIQTQHRIRYVVPLAIFKLRNFFKKNGIDTAISIGIGMNPLLVVACMFTSVKIIFCEHSNLKNIYNKAFSHRFCQWVGAKFANRVVTLTEQDRRNYISCFNMKAEKVSAIYNFVEEGLLRASISYDITSKLLISAGRVDPVKGYDMLLDVATIVFDQHPDWKWHIWGSGVKSALGKELARQILLRGLEAKVILMGTSSCIYDIYQQYSMLVLTSYYEGFPMVLLEAQAKGLPVVSFDCPTGPGEIVSEGVNGFLVPCYDTEIMAERICMLIENEKLRESFSEHSRIQFEKVEKNRIIEQWKNLIEEI